MTWENSVMNFSTIPTLSLIYLSFLTKFKILIPKLKSERETLSPRTKTFSFSLSSTSLIVNYFWEEWILKQSHTKKPSEFLVLFGAWESLENNLKSSRDLEVIKKIFLFFYKRSRRLDHVVDSSTCGSCDNWEEMIWRIGC